MIRTRLVLSVLLIGTFFSANRMLGQGPTPAQSIEKRTPAPVARGNREIKGGWEIKAPIPYASVQRASDGRLMMVGNGKVSWSNDGGRSWTAPVSLSVPVDSTIVLSSGRIGGSVPETPKTTAQAERGNLWFFVSNDDGKHWTRRGKITVGAMPGSSYPNSMIQTSSGRLILPVRTTEGAGHMGLYDIGASWGIFDNVLRPIEGHAHFPEPDNAFVFYSDDEGQTWSRSEGGIMIWSREGRGGMWPCDEPTIVESRSGNVHLFCRTSLGRVYIARSTSSEFRRDGVLIKEEPGYRFDLPEPTKLAASYSPNVAVRIPKTGDWLLVWNQVSGDEIRAGYRRGRLSSAISTNDGRCWEHFRTIDTVVLPPAGQVEPDPEPQLARSLDFVGSLPDDYGAVDYPTVNIVDDTVFLGFSRNLLKPKSSDVTGSRLRVLPLTWFYEGEQPVHRRRPKVVVHVLDLAGKTLGEHDIPSVFYQGRFYCHLQDLSPFLKSPVGSLGVDMFGPINQIITTLGWRAKYDEAHLGDATNPKLIVNAMLPKFEP